MTKLCGTCGETLALAAFGKHAGHSDGLSSVCRPCKSTGDKAYRAKNLDKIITRKRAYALEHREQAAATNKAYYAKKRADPSFIEARAKALHEWQQANPDKIKMSNARRVALKKSASIEDLPSDFFTTMKEFYGSKCMFPGCTETSDLQPDHIIPLSKGGSHSADNLQILCAHHNYSKGNRNAIDYRPIDRLKFGIIKTSVLL